MHDWKIDRRHDRCSACGQGFIDGGVYYSVLLVAPAGLERRDHCPSCFRGRTAQAGVEEIIFWRTRHLLNKGRSLALDFELIERLFLALETRPEETLSELRYLLSLLLLRKKRLKLTRVEREGVAERLIVRRPRREEALAVRVHELSAERLEGLRGELESVFDGTASEWTALATPAIGESSASLG